MPRDQHRNAHRGLTRRQVLQLYGAGVIAVGGGAVALERNQLWTTSAARILPNSKDVATVERQRPNTGRTRTFELNAAASDVDLAGRRASTWTFNGQVPHQELRVTSGDTIVAKLRNRLSDPTTIHWHGLALRNDMDGVPGLTQKAVAPGQSFTYRFLAPHPGTYWFHPHVGVQLDRGLYGPLIIEDPNEPLNYDEEVVLVLDDWTDGVGQSPDALLKDMTKNGMKSMSSMSGMGGMGGMDMNGMSPNATGMGITKTNPLGEDTGDVQYPLHLINGRPRNDPHVISTRPGKRLRVRIINAASDTAYRFAIGGHRLTVVHSDGYPTQPVETDTLILGMGERYDVLIDTIDGAFPVVASPEGKKDAPAFAVLRTASGTTPTVSAPELQRQLIGYADLAPTGDALRSAKVDRTVTAKLTMKGGGRQWLINGKTYANREPLDVKTGERVQLNLVNASMMFHPMHLHGHTFALLQGNRPGLRKDTINVLPMQRISVVLDADNPGQWLLHCHNAYHGELGMMTALSYIR